MPSEVRFAAVRKKLEEHDWTLIRTKGSHHLFRKEGELRLICIPVHKGRVAHVYIRQIEKEHGIVID